MKQEILEQLRADYPFIRIQDEYGYPSCTCGDGWYNLINDFCSEILSYSQDNSIPIDDLIVATIKEKHGSLCIYFITNNIELSAFLGSKRAEYEELSTKVCEKCGNEGDSQRIRKLYVKTVCTDCAAILNNRDVITSNQGVEGAPFINGVYKIGRKALTLKLLLQIEKNAKQNI